MNWKYVKPLKKTDSIYDFEESEKVEFPDSYIATVKKFNGGRPEKSIYDTDKTKERTIKSLLSFNDDDRETIRRTAENLKEELNGKYIAFASDNFGNLICFDKKDMSVVFFDLETLNTEKIANDFSAFLDKLYDDE